ncbi:hypothetical protein ASPACDRAFT_1888636 [Aspergillus aculeatus ATCC 16872]|uniref:Uncharacterized protein n=1 Tax=Aspergillus aculeatus (strain ATCC 16872 / CBS 172.66 / WB 5094) TaxID=690307 RepID=A0A1L9WUS6_ASPA1|nr:uncharacterized protein ASPACDRAFT_1888636 [Aspergillus aculeatus ATCC 16872]OJK00007.1 hypothetical protein ASPACDRAFT_1888636 [Aspergillus aculeatus ATCC 16872]
MCERQITVPDNTLLYCSESCRRKDSHKPLSASFSSAPSMSSSSTPPSSPLMSPRMIVAPLTPTRSSTRLSSSARIPGEWLDIKTDQDPSEWKPVIPMGNGAHSVATSDAWKYLSQFHNDDRGVPLRRPGLGHRSSASLTTLISSTGPVPSLTHTPSTVASSFSSNASDYMSQMHDPTYRPLPPRHNPHFCSSSAAKGVELVVPHVHVQAEDVSPVDMSNDGSIFPASSALWNDKPLNKTSTLTTTLGAVSSDVPMRSV